jgi:predicted nucleic acid-binding protein
MTADAEASQVGNDIELTQTRAAVQDPLDAGEARALFIATQHKQIDGSIL